MVAKESTKGRKGQKKAERRQREKGEQKRWAETMRAPVLNEEVSHAIACITSLVTQ
jgi:hypothetical protein